jgi:hypothetical protein
MWGKGEVSITSTAMVVGRFASSERLRNAMRGLLVARVTQDDHYCPHLLEIFSKKRLTLTSIQANFPSLAVALPPWTPLRLHLHAACRSIVLIPRFSRSNQCVEAKALASPACDAAFWIWWCVSSADGEVEAACGIVWCIR